MEYPPLKSCAMHLPPAIMIYPFYLLRTDVTKIEQTKKRRVILYESDRTDFKPAYQKNHGLE